MSLPRLHFVVLVSPANYMKIDKTLPSMGSSTSFLQIMNKKMSGSLAPTNSQKEQLKEILPSDITHLFIIILQKTMMMRDVHSVPYQPFPSNLGVTDALILREDMS